jgi:hypothetical protein
MPTVSGDGVALDYLRNGALLAPHLAVVLGLPGRHLPWREDDYTRCLMIAAISSLLQGAA